MTMTVDALEAELKASEDRFKKVFSLSPSLIAISTVEDGRHYAVNQAWLNAFGFVQDEVIGKTAQEMGVWPNPEDRQRFIEEFRRTNSIRNYEAQLQTKAGDPLIFEISGCEVEFDHAKRLMLVFNDITKRKKAEWKLQATMAELERQVDERTKALQEQIKATKQAESDLLESEQKLQETNRMLHSVLDTIPVRVFWKDKSLKYLGCNRMFARDAGFPNPRLVVGKTDHQMPWKDQADAYRADDAHVINTVVPKVDFEETQVTSKGDTIWLRTSKFPLRNIEGDVVGILGMYEDITEKKKIDHELKHAKEAAEAANQAKSAFLSSMSHELRTPLNAILGFAQLLEYDPNNPLTPAQTESIDHIKSGGKHLLHLINEILDLAKIEAGKVEFDIHAIDPQDILQEALPLVMALADKRSITVLAPVLQKSVPHVMVDFTRVKQVLLNLMSNAVKYNREEGHVTIDAEVIDGYVRFLVTDTGQGIPEKKMPMLFKPFSRLGAEETSIEGTGIGLTITKELVEHMGGRIGVDSVVGVGSTFWVEFPIATDAPEAAVSIENDKDFLTGRVEDAGFDGTVLYVEDNAANTLFMESVFERFANLRLITATNAETGIEKAKKENPDMIILDVALPGMSGNDAVKLLREDAGFKSKPIIALSANAMQQDIKTGMESGFDAYLTKPLDIRLLMAELEKVFGRLVVDE